MSKLFIQMSGAPGSGKSTVAYLLAPTIDGIVFDHDTIKSTVLDNGVPFNEAAKLTYNLGWTFARDMIRQGRSVIIDSTCNFQETLVRGFTLAQEYGYDYWYIECQVDDIDTLDQRLRTRVPLRSQRRGVDCPPPDLNGQSQFEDSRSLFKSWMEAPVRPENSARTIILDSTGSPENRRDYILERIHSSQNVRDIPRISTRATV